MNLVKFYRNRFWITLSLALVFVVLIFIQVNRELIIWRLLLCYALSQLFGAIASYNFHGWIMFKDIWNTNRDVVEQIEFLSDDKYRTK